MFFPRPYEGDEFRLSCFSFSRKSSFTPLHSALFASHHPQLPRLCQRHDPTRRPHGSGAQAIQIPRSRFAPVKKTDDLLALRSDAYRLTEVGENGRRNVGRSVGSGVSVKALGWGREGKQT